MRAFKFITLILIATYILLFSYVNFSFENKNKKKVLDQISADQSTSRIILFGKSPCEIGLSAKQLSQELNRKFYNYCHYTFYNQSNLFELLNNLNKDDYVIITRRLEFLKTRNLDFLQNITFMRLAQYFLDDVLRNFYNVEPYDRFGDIMDIPTKDAETFPSYLFDGQVIENNLQQQFDAIFKDRKNLPHIIWLTSPLLVDPASSLPISTIRHECHDCSQLIAWFPPPQYNDRSLFVDDKIHLNTKGRAVWSREVAAELKDIFSR